MVTDHIPLDRVVTDQALATQISSRLHNRNRSTVAIWILARVASSHSINPYQACLVAFPADFKKNNFLADGCEPHTQLHLPPLGHARRCCCPCLAFAPQRPPWSALSVSPCHALRPHGTCCLTPGEDHQRTHPPHPTHMVTAP